MQIDVSRDEQVDNHLNDDEKALESALKEVGERE